MFCKERETVLPERELHHDEGVLAGMEVAGILHLQVVLEAWVSLEMQNWGICDQFRWH
jgi:hypothetical protein